MFKRDEKKKEGDQAKNANTVDAASSPRQDKDVESSEARGKDAASTLDAASTEQTRQDAASTGGAASTEDAASTGDAASTDKPAGSEDKVELDWKALYALTLADFDNFKKRAARDREDVYRYAESDILKDVLPAVDNLALALASAKQRGQETAAPVDGDAATVDASAGVDAASSPRENSQSTAFASFVKGVQLVYDTLLKSLKDHGAEPFDSVGLPLDTEKMEAIATLPSDEVEEGKVSIESKRGWMLKGKVLRAAQVVVSSGKPQ